MKSKRYGQIALNGLLLVLIVINVFPILWMISSAFKLPDELFTQEIRLIPLHPTLDNFKTALFEYDFFSWLFNSVGTTLGMAFLQVIVAVLAAFALTYYRTRFNKFWFAFIIATMVIPFQVTMIPNYILVSRANMLNTWSSVIIPGIANATTFYFLFQHMRSVPKTFYEVSRLEGAGSFWALRHVALGICKGAISAMLILCVIDAWNQYFWPLLVLSKPESRTLTVGLQQFLDHEAGNRWGP
ncbi:MAG: carbohydrate ABC transporter permease, partial [Clostridia bacterium]